MRKLQLHLGYLLIGILMTAGAYAQGGRTALGIRLTPDGGGFSGKFFTDRSLAIETQLNVGGLLSG